MKKKFTMRLPFGLTPSRRHDTDASLILDRHVAITPSRSIILANIATLSVGRDNSERPRLVYAAMIAMLSFLAAATWFANAATANAVSYLIVMVFSGLAATFTYLLFKPDDPTTYLIIVSNDGQVSRFTGPDEDMLVEALRLITDRIGGQNGGRDGGGTYQMDFARGIIRPMADDDDRHQRAPAAALPAPNNGSHTRPSTNGRGAPRPSRPASAQGGSQQRNAPQHAMQRSAPNTASPASRGYGNGAGPAYAGLNGSDPTPAFGNGAASQARMNGGGHGDARSIDFSNYLPSVVEMHRFYARQPNSEPLEQRLSELELLMRSGAGSAQQRQRIRDLSNDLAEILSAYPQVADVFHQISDVAID